PACTNSSSLAAASGMASGLVTATASKPARLASSAIILRRIVPADVFSEVEVRIVRYRGKPPYAVGEQRPERGPRFYPRIPVACRGEIPPVDLAQIVEDGKRRRGRQIRIGDPRAGEPGAGGGEPVRVFHVLPDIGPGRTDGRR